MPRKRPKARQRARGTGAVWEYAPGLWAGQFPARVDLRRRTLYGFPSADAAHAALDDELARLEDARTLDERPDQPVGHYLEHSYDRRDLAYLALIAAVPLDVLTPEHLEDVWAGLRRRGLSLATIRHARGTLSMALDAAVPRLISENPNRAAHSESSAPSPEIDLPDRR